MYNSVPAGLWRAVTAPRAGTSKPDCVLCLWPRCCWTVPLGHVAGPQNSQGLSSLTWQKVVWVQTPRRLGFFLGLSRRDSVFYSPQALDLWDSSANAWFFSWALSWLLLLWLLMRTTVFTIPYFPNLVMSISGMWLSVSLCKIYIQM